MSGGFVTIDLSETRPLPEDETKTLFYDIHNRPLLSRCSIFPINESNRKKLCIFTAVQLPIIIGVGTAVTYFILTTAELGLDTKQKAGIIFITWLLLILECFVCSCRIARQ